MDDKASTNGWNRIGAIRSSTNPTEKYVVALRTTGYLGCSCKSWIYKKGTKEHDGFKDTCKHIRALLDETIDRSTFEATNFGTTWLMKRAEARYAKFQKPMKKTA
jgi:hypothetical protein